jgi:AcrR family transcriptional regulator
MLQWSSIRDWRALTVRGVAEQAGVNERTVYRYFGDERGLRDAVMHRLEEESGIELDGMRLEDVGDIAARIFEHVASYPSRPKPALDPTLADANLRQRRALAGALAEATPGWSESDRRTVAALFDVLWSVSTYERLVTDWDLGSTQATRGAIWAIDVLRRAVHEGPPGPSSAGRAARRARR